MAEEFVVGVEELNARLRELSNVMQTTLLVSAAKAGAELLQPEIASRAPRLTIATQAKPGKSNVAEGRVDVGPVKKQFYARFLEFGTRSRFDSGAARAAGFPGRSRSANRRGGVRPRPAVIPARVAKEADVIEAVKTKLIERLDQIAK